MKKVYCLYHDQCMDGFASATVLYDRFYDDITKNEVQVNFIPVRYGEPPPVMDEYADVYILDFSYPVDVLIDMSKRYAYIGVIDHHKTAQADLSRDQFDSRGFSTKQIDQDGGFEVNDSLFIRFDMTHSGCVLTYSHFHGLDDGVPELLAYVEDRDLWKFKLPDSQNMTAVIQTWTFDLDYWRDRMNFWNEKAIKGEANIVIRVRNKIVGQQLLSRHYVVIDPEGRKIINMPAGRYDEIDGTELIPAVNATAFVSETCHALLKLNPSAKYVASYRKTQNLNVEWSLRTHNDDFDVSKIAKKMGGGGHKGAAGFTTKGTP